MNLKVVFFLSLFLCNLSYSQVSIKPNSNPESTEKEGIKPDRLKIKGNIVMPKDSLAHESLLFSVNAFLSAAEKNIQNEWMLAAESVETQILIDEIQDIQKSKEFGEEFFFSPYLTNIIPLEKDKYAIHIAYIGIHDQSAVLRANFELIAHKTKDIFLISSPLLKNTKNWTSIAIQNHIFHYPYDIDEEKVKDFANHVVFCDEKLNNNIGETHYYMCRNEMDPLKLFGVEYKSDYNGDGFMTRWLSQNDEKTLWVLNESQIYNANLHDLWHNRLSQVISRKKVHRRVDCHIATLYGGLWGMSWESLFPLFSEKYVVGKNVDWLAHKENKTHFITQGRRKNYTDDFVGALLIRKIEKEKGFDGVWKLLMTKRTKAEEEYFKVLEELTGITKESYNMEVSKLIEEEMNKLGI